jgi:nucleotide-binding universal stress UspA family protein
MKTVLVAADGSDHSSRAIDFAIELAQRFDAGLTVLNVVASITAVPLAMGAYAEVEGIYAGEGDALTQIGDDICNEAEKRAREAGVTFVETRVETGSPAHVIAEFADEIDADVIVMGRRGLGDLGGLLLGSVSHKVGHLVDRTLITVR